MKANAPVERSWSWPTCSATPTFKNNLWFAKTNRRMIDVMANHATRVRHHIDRHGVEAVEDFIDACLSLENLIDYHVHFIERQDKKERAGSGGEDEEATPEVPRLKSKRYMEKYINPPAFIEEQKAKIAKRRKRKRMVPEEPLRYVLQFLIEHAPRNWGVTSSPWSATGLLLRPGDGEGGNRLGLVLAQHDHDPAGADRLRLIDFADHHSAPSP
jgi:spore cortex formation protein SpoVR/YcgB (stage V sporulation)